MPRVRLVEPIWKVQPRSYLLLPAADSKRSARPRPYGSDVRARANERAARGNAIRQRRTETDRIRQAFLERTLMGTEFIPLGDVLRLVDQIRRDQNARVSKRSGSHGELSTHARALLNLVVTDVGWGR